MIYEQDLANSCTQKIQERMRKTCERKQKKKACYLLVPGAIDGQEESKKRITCWRCRQEESDKKVGTGTGGGGWQSGISTEMDAAGSASAEDEPPWGTRLCLSMGGRRSTLGAWGRENNGSGSIMPLVGKLLQLQVK